MGAKEDLLADLVRRDASGSVEPIHRKLVGHGFKWKGPKNSQTLLYLFRLDGKEVGIAAMRRGIFSFPAPFWGPRAPALRLALGKVPSYQQVSTEPAISSSQYSAGQIQVGTATLSSLPTGLRSSPRSQARNGLGLGVHSEPCMRMYRMTPMEPDNDPLLWNLDEVARQLGGVSPRTVRRLIERDELPKVRVGRRLLVPSAAVHAYVAKGHTPADNEDVEQGALAPTRGESACLSKRKGSLRNRTVGTDTPTSPTRAASDLNDLLGL